MIKIAHEAPLDIFEEVQRFTDYDYALVHLLEENPRYRDAFERAIKKKGREVILDNSIFELEEAFEADRFVQWVERLRPTWYIVPDALEDSVKTCQQMADWNTRYPNVPGNKIGVVQGKTYEEIVNCYKYMDNSDVDMIAISFDYSYYTVSVPHPNKYVSWMLGRVKLLGDLLRDGTINTEKPHHLLGCGLPQEFAFYKHADYKWIYSLDTSNPVVHGIKGITYASEGLWNKESQKLHELINMDLEDIDIDRVRNNIQKFRWYANGRHKVDSVL